MHPVRSRSSVRHPRRRPRWSRAPDFDIPTMRLAITRLSPTAKTCLVSFTIICRLQSGALFIGRLPFRPR